MAQAQRILVIEDDNLVVTVIRTALTRAGFTVETSSTGKDAVSRLGKERFDLAMVDLHLPDMDGLDIVRSLENRSDIAVIIVTGSGDAADRVIGLELGADDYITKPFETRELVVRTRNLLRRIERIRSDSSQGDGIRKFDTWTFDRVFRSVQREGDKRHELTPTEFRLLDILSSNPNRVLTRDRILDLMHAGGDSPYDRSIDVTIMRLRRKIEQQPARPRFIRTMRNEGYMFTNSRD